MVSTICISNNFRALNVISHSLNVVNKRVLLILCLRSRKGKKRIEIARLNSQVRLISTIIYDI